MIFFSAMKTEFDVYIDPESKQEVQTLRQPIYSDDILVGFISLKIFVVKTYHLYQASIEKLDLTIPDIDWYIHSGILVSLFGIKFHPCFLFAPYELCDENPYLFDVNEIGLPYQLEWKIQYDSEIQVIKMKDEYLERMTSIPTVITYKSVQLCYSL